MSKKRKALIAILFLAAAVIMSLPLILNAVCEYQVSQVVAGIKESEEETDYSEMLAAAQDYNVDLLESVHALTDFYTDNTPEGKKTLYYSLLNMTDDGAMGYVEIPSIDVEIPIYHGTSDDVLNKGVGHLYGSSLPVGGTSTHAVVTGHTGLSRAKLFTDLTEVQIGDIFYIHTCGTVLAYEVDQIKIVLPEETEDLEIIEGEDHVTLVTCTPYGVNTHRLLVRGTRTEISESYLSGETQESTAESVWLQKYLKYLLIDLLVIAVVVIIVLIVKAIKRHNSARGRR